MEKTWVQPQDEGKSDGGAPVVFLPGWGFDGRILSLADQPLPWHAPAFFLDPALFPETLLDYLSTRGFQKIRLVGWSMGGNLALAFAGKYPEKVSGLSLLSVRQHWPAPEIEAIRQALATDPARFMASFYRKCFLGDKGRYQRFVAQMQDGYLRGLDLQTLQRGLDFLQSLGAEKPVALPGADIFCLHGGKDIIAPVEERARIPGARYLLDQQGGHVFFLHRDFRLPQGDRKQGIRRRFSRAAGTYDAYADVQKKLAARLAEALPAGRQCDTILELGCGTGNFTRKLATLYPHAEIVAVDFSEEMLRVAGEKLPQAGVHFVCEDGEHFLAGGKMACDLIVSNAALQWFDDLEAAVFQARRLLKPQGFFIASIFGSQTLGELARGLALLTDGAAPIPAGSFPDRESLAALFTEYFKTVRLESWQVVKEYASMQEMLTPLARTGTTGGQAGRARLTRQLLRRLDDWFLAAYGKYRLTYQAFIIGCEP